MAQIAPTAKSFHNLLDSLDGAKHSQTLTCEALSYAPGLQAMWDQSSDDSPLPILIERLDLQNANPEIRLAGESLLSGFALGCRSSGDGEYVFAIVRSCQDIVPPAGGVELCLSIIKNNRGFNGIPIDAIIEVILPVYARESSNSNNGHGAAHPRESEHQRAMYQLLESRLVPFDLLDSYDVMDLVSQTALFTAQTHAVLQSILRVKKPEEVMQMLVAKRLEEMNPGLGALIRKHLNEQLGRMCDVNECGSPPHAL